MPVNIRPLPVPVQDPEDLPPLIYADTVYLRCLPYIQIRTLDPGQAPESSAPYAPWDMALETHWRKIHPRVWEILGEDQGKDWAAIHRRGEEWQRAAQCGKLTAEVEKVIGDLLTKLKDRVVLRSNRFLALNEARNTVFAMEAARKPGLTIDEFLQALPTGDLSRFATHPVASLWPLPSVDLPCEGLTLVKSDNCVPYMVPSHPSAAYDAWTAKQQSSCTPPSRPNEKHLAAQRKMYRHIAAKKHEKQD